MNDAIATFDIRNFYDKLTPTKTKNKFYCPACDGNDLSIDPDTGAYQCWHGCSCYDIREAVSPREKQQQQNPNRKMINTPLAKKPAPSRKPAPLPQGKLAIARLSEVPTDIPQPRDITTAEMAVLLKSWKGCSIGDLVKATTIIYDYGNNRTSHRFQKPCSKNPKGYEKTFMVSCLDDQGNRIWGKGDTHWGAYHQDEAIQAALAVEDGCVSVVLAHEGESCVECGRAQKLAGLTVQGGAGEKDWAHILSEIKLQMGKRPFVLGYCPDNDKPGIGKANTLSKVAARCQVPLAIVDLKAIFFDLCEKGDIVDVLGGGMTGDELAKAILEQIEQQQQQELLVDEDVKGVEDGVGEQPSVDPSNPESIYESACKSLGLPFENCVTEVAFDTWIYNNEFSAAENWRVIDSAFYKWSPDQQYWQHQPDNRINTLVADCGEEAFKISYNKVFGWKISKPYGTNSHAESAFKYVRKRLERPEPLPTNTHLLAFSNCVVDLRTGQQMPHSKDHYLTSSIPLEFKPGKECPEDFRKFVTESFGADMIEPIRAFTSMFLDPTAPYGRFPHLIGQSGGGKGTMGRFWSNLFGEQGSGSAAQFSDLTTPEGRHQYLAGKRIFGFPDVGGYTQNVRSFYELVDNGAMTGRALFNSTAYSKQWYTRFWLASVNHLQVENAGDGWARRAYPIPVVSRSVKPDPDLRAKLEACKADVMSWALAMPRHERDRILLSPPESERAKDLALDASLYGDSTMSFIDSCLRPSKDTNYVPNHQLHTWYVAYCREHGYTPLAYQKFISHLKTVQVLQHNYQKRGWSPTVDGKRTAIEAHWKYLAPLPNLFVSSEPGISNTDQNPLWFCVKSRCSEGGLSEFQDYWSPKTPEPLPSIAVRPVQATLEVEMKAAQAEILTQSTCAGCAVVPSIDPATLKKNNEQQNIFSPAPSSPMVLEVESRSEQSAQSAQLVPERVSGCAPSESDNEQSAQSAQLDTERVSGISISESTSKADDPRAKQWTDEQIAQLTTEESLRDIANLLDDCDSAQVLSDLRWIYPRKALKQAKLLLSPDKQKQISQWVIQLNDEFKK